MNRRPFRPARTPVALALLALSSAAALAQSGAPDAADAPAAVSGGESSLELGRITVTERRQGPLRSRSLLTSVDVVQGETLQGQSTQSTWELFQLSPGTLLTNYNQGTTSGKVSMRGFNGEGEVNAVKLLVDGIPSNSNDGNMPYLDAVFPLELQAIETVRGTNDARYGLHNIAGNVSLVTRQGGNESLGRVGAGSFNSRELQAAQGIEQGAWAQNYFFGYKAGDGWRDHADSRKFTLAGKWFYTAEGGGWRAGVTARHFEHRADEPGYLTAADARATPRRSYAFVATDGGERRIDQLGVQAEGTAAHDLSWQALAYLNRFDDTRWVRFSAGVAQQERIAEETHRGARASLSWRPRVQALHEFALEGGIDTEQQRNRSDRWLSAGRVRTNQTRDQDFTFDTYGAYVQGVLRPVASVKLVPALRVDTVRGRLDNGLNGARYQINDYGTIRQPKLSMVWTPAAGQALYANWGRTFQLGVGAGAYKVPPRVTDLRPSINDGWELGWKFQPAPWLEGRLARWAQTASDEVKRNLNSPTGDSDNLGRTRRQGVDLQLTLRPADTVQAWVALTRQEALIVEPDPAAPATRGKEIDHVPRHVFNAGIDWNATPALKLSAWAQGQGDYYIERENARGRFGGYTLLNVGATWAFSDRWRLEAQVRNVTNRFSEYVWWDGTQSLHSPGMRRALFVALSASL
ncbi:TonB-dependent receptor [Azohydromonas aeria]|uniref:TonB-dependent receptor n=1 Tax=Azohydromonas aeria TaxID=2590212 RepID=UPI0012F8D35A|nr:TonB-dependent receptor [Azohydromonas aeria]